MPSSQTSNVYRGFLVYPERQTNGQAILKFFSDGALKVSPAGTIEYCGAWSNLNVDDQKLPTYHWKSEFILPGFVDTHVHFPQMDMIGCHGEDLLGWLNKYTFPEESKFADRSYAERSAKKFINSLTYSGTTRACIFSSSHFEATDAIFAAFDEMGMKASIGQVSMDRHAPEALLNKDLTKHEEEFYLLKDRWHNKDGRLAVAITPRFAPSCTDDLLRLNARMSASVKDALVQTHFAESKAEVEWLKQLYPKSRDYLGVYEDFGLVHERSIFAHAIHLSESELTRLKAARSRVAHCPSSNLFLGSGIMNWRALEGAGIRFGLGSDVGAGTSLSHWHTMADAYKSQRLMGVSLSPAELLASATIDAQRALDIAPQPTGFSIGAPADFQVVNIDSSETLRRRFDEGQGPDAMIFALIWRWQWGMTTSVYVQGKKMSSVVS